MNYSHNTSFFAELDWGGWGKLIIIDEGELATKSIPLVGTCTYIIGARGAHTYNVITLPLLCMHARGNKTPRGAGPYVAKYLHKKRNLHEDNP